MSGVIPISGHASGMRALHLFAGAGGSVLAGRLLGWGSVGAVEIDPFCCAVLEAHGERILGGDVCSYHPPAEGIDVVVGGFPCQDVSVAGKRAGSGDGTRSGLWRHMLRVWDECHAPWIFAENVRGLLSSDGGRDYAAILEALASRGADAVWCTLRASDVGAPHRRERWFLLAKAAGEHGHGAGIARDGRAESSDSGGRAGILADAGSHGGAGRGDASDIPATPGGAEREGHQRERMRNTIGNGGPDRPVGHARGDGREEQRQPVDARQEIAAAWKPGRRETQPALGIPTYGLANGVAVWPAGRGAPQHAWEAPRTIAHKEPGRIPRP